MIHEQEVADVRWKCKAKVKEALRSRKDLQSEMQKTVDKLKVSLASVMVAIMEDRLREAEEIRETHKEEMEARQQKRAGYLTISTQASQMILNKLRRWSLSMTSFFRLSLDLRCLPGSRQGTWAL